MWASNLSDIFYNCEIIEKNSMKFNRTICSKPLLEIWLDNIALFAHDELSWIFLAFFIKCISLYDMISFGIGTRSLIIVSLFLSPLIAYLLEIYRNRIIILGLPINTTISYVVPLIRHDFSMIDIYFFFYRLNKNHNFILINFQLLI